MSSEPRKKITLQDQPKPPPGVVIEQIPNDYESPDRREVALPEWDALTKDDKAHPG